MLRAIVENKLYKVLKWAVDSDAPGQSTADREVASLSEADVVSSRVSAEYIDPFEYRDDELHTVVLDIDVPCETVTSTNGNTHLFIDAKMTWPEYQRVLLALGNAGVLEPGYVGASLARGYTAVRLPWVEKPKA